MVAVTIRIDKKFALAKHDFIQMFLSAWRRRGYEVMQIISGKIFVFKRVA